MTLLTINAGSSSIKFAVFEEGKRLLRLHSGEIERIGLPNVRFVVKNFHRDGKNHDEHSSAIQCTNFSSAIDFFSDWLKHEYINYEFNAIGHRVVHGGSLYDQPELITPDVLKELEKLFPYDPEHMPNEVLLISRLLHVFPNSKQVAFFDTSFHFNLPKVSQMLAVPRAYWEKGLRRFGFHGISYQFLMDRLLELFGTKVSNGRIILAHLGNGASLAAVFSGQPVDTSMGFTPSSGVMMSTRSGDIDPGLITFLMKQERLTIDQINNMINFESGLLGISGTTSDMKDLLELENNDVRAAEAVSLFCYQIKKQIGAYTASLGGIDTLVFSGGIGQNCSIIRERICTGMDFLGLEIDLQQNSNNRLTISTQNSKVRVLVIPTDEELMLAMMLKLYSL